MGNSRVSSWIKKVEVEARTEDPGERSWTLSRWSDTWRGWRDPSALSVPEKAVIESLQKILVPSQRQVLQAQLAVVSQVLRARRGLVALTDFKGLGPQSGSPAFRVGYPEALLGTARLIWENGACEARVTLAGGWLKTIEWKALGADANPHPQSDFDLEDLQSFR